MSGTRLSAWCPRACELIREGKDDAALIVDTLQDAYLSAYATTEHRNPRRDFQRLLEWAVAKTEGSTWTRPHIDTDAFRAPEAFHGQLTREEPDPYWTDLSWLAQVGAVEALTDGERVALIGVDHLPKGSESRASGYAIWGTAKKRAMTGAYLLVERVTEVAVIETTADGV